MSIPLGLAGLALCWTVAAELKVTPRWPGRVSWLLTTLALIAVAVPYLRQVLVRRRLAAELADPTFGPFTAVVTILVMLLGGALAELSPSLGRGVFIIGLLATVALGGYLSGGWIIAPTEIAHWHPGYFLPTVAGGLLASSISAGMGWPHLAELMFGYGLVSWIVLGSIILARLFTQQPLSLALRPTLAIEVAPSAVAGNAWFAMNGGRPDLMAYALAGYGTLMVLVQIRLIPLYREVPFGPGTWTFSFSYAAVAAVWVRWLVAEQVPGRTAVAYVLLAVMTLGELALAIRTAVALRRGSFLPRLVGDGPT